MASVRKRAESAFWYACITLADGRQRQFSTGLRDKAEALAVAGAAERAARKHHQSPHQLRAALDRIAEDFIPAGDKDPAVWIEAWAASRKAEVAGNTFEAYERTATEVAAWLREKGIGGFAALTPALVTEIRNFWAGGNSAVTANTKMKHLRMALKVAKERDKLLEANPADHVANLKEKKTPRREFRPAELKLLVPTLTGEWRALFFLGLNTGQRLNDLAVMKAFQIDLRARTVTLTTAKTDSLVALPLMDDAVNALKALPANMSPNGFVFPEIAALAKTTRSNQFRAKLSKVGLARPVKAKAGGKGRRAVSELSFHSLRHTTTSMLKSAGVADSIARAIVGHQSAAVSRAYTHLDMDTMRAAMEKMPTVA